MADLFNPDVIAAVKGAKFCRVAVYPAVRGWCGERVQLEVADEIDALGHTDQLRGAGHWLAQNTTPERVAEEVERLRGAPVLVSRRGDAFGAVDNFEGEGLANQ
ncbi:MULTISPECIES: hypothetical protein [Aeromonas]|uniref:hypothetical protein n=1 Tax=Aeromonas TaxID=642 RepID=UPI001CC7FAEF|nr:MULTISPECIES: hypothetical protein [Aeromonas]WEA31688.1 hypothetical protein PWO56_07740 [Aeromonas hydrophila]WEA32204.1 hypothetical protein PWO56_10450 [Aeromonas hydrophila]GJA45482.1 hypothetical protein KAM346_17710 [Aeromonas caviae]